jgi:hypothetical protein
MDLNDKKDALHPKYVTYGQQDTDSQVHPNMALPHKTLAQHEADRSTTSIDLDKLEALSRAATSGIWTNDRGYLSGPPRSYNECYFENPADAEFIVAAKANMPRLIDLARRATTAPQAATTEQVGAVGFPQRMKYGAPHSAGYVDGFNACLQLCQLASPAATTASASGAKLPIVDVWVDPSTMQRSLLDHGTPLAPFDRREFVGSLVWSDDPQDVPTTVDAEIADLRAALAGREAAPLPDDALLRRAGAVVHRLYNNTPNVSDAVEAGSVIQWLVGYAVEARKHRAALAQPAAPAGTQPDEREGFDAMARDDWRELAELRDVLEIECEVPATAFQFAILRIKRLYRERDEARAEAARATSDTARLDWMIAEECQVERTSHLPGAHFKVCWPLADERQSVWFSNPRDAIDDAMRAAKATAPAAGTTVAPYPILPPADLQADTMDHAQLQALGKQGNGVPELIRARMGPHPVQDNEGGAA